MPLARTAALAGWLWAAALAAGAPSPEGPLLRIEGGYLAHSYDYNQTLGEDVTIDWQGWTIKARSLKIDVPGRQFEVLGQVELIKGSERRTADAFFFEAAKPEGILIRFGPVVEMEAFGRNRPAAELDAEIRIRQAALAGVGWEKMRASLVYATAKTIEITPAYEVYGTDITFYVEGTASVGMARFKLSMGDENRSGGFSLDKIWFTRTQGLFGDLRYSILKENAIDSVTQLHYEEHSLLSDYSGLPRQLDLRTSTTWSAGERSKLGLEGDYSSTGLWNARMFLLTRDQAAKNSVLFEALYRQPLGGRGETWLGVQTRLASEKWGRLSFQGRYEMHDQTLAGLAYEKAFGTRLSFRLKTDYSHVRFSNGASASKIFTAGVTLAYSADPIQAAADYYLNSDLLGDRRLHRPQLRFGLTPFSFYGGLLTASFSNVFVQNSVTGSRGASETYNDNTVFSLAAAPFWIRPGLFLRLSLTAEQFVEKEGRNFTTGGAIIRAAQELGMGVTLEAIYGFQSRRRTRDWLIEGTTSQDLSVYLRIRPESRLSGWVSIAYDPKYRDWKQGFADLSLGLVRGWKFQSLLNYDFAGRRLADIDLYLVRQAGRFDLRFVWRSLSKQFLIELVPSGEAAPPVKS
jgi:hypothetical protein